VTARDPQRVADLVEQLDIELRPRPDGLNHVIVDGRDVTGDIRSPEVGRLASELSALPGVRERMVALQQQMARDGGVVMEGRDIQTVVLPHAEVKIFLTGPAEERARRRWQEFKQQGFGTALEEVLDDVRARDERDSNRAHSPLAAAPDAVEVDSGGLTIDEVVEQVLRIVRARTA
jgi:cytidylate kinase